MLQGTREAPDPPAPREGVSEPPGTSFETRRTSGPSLLRMRWFGVRFSVHEVGAGHRARQQGRAAAFAEQARGFRLIGQPRVDLGRKGAAAGDAEGPYALEVQR